MAMAAAVLAIARPGILIENPGCVSKSYPGFFRDLESLAVRTSRQ
jgi:3-phosphoshikimate 1-carboxyvinyltransferase